MTSFNDFVNRLYGLSGKGAFKKEIRKFLEFYESSTPEIIDKDKGHIIVYNEIHEPTNSYELIEISFDGVLYSEAEMFCDEPSKITADLDNQRLKRYISDWLSKLEKAKLISSNDQFFRKFPLYLKVLDLLMNKLEVLRLSLNLEKGKRGRKRTLTPVEEAEIITHAEKLLSDKPDYFKPRRGSHVSKLLKRQVYDDLKSSIPNATIHIVSRLLYDFYYARNSQ